MTFDQPNSKLNTARDNDVERAVDASGTYSGKPISYLIELTVLFQATQDNMATTWSIRLSALKTPSQAGLATPLPLVLAVKILTLELTPET